MSIVQIHAAISKLCCVSMPMLHVHVHNACPCPCCMSMSMLHIHVIVHVHIYRNAGMPDRPASSQSGTGLKWKKLMMPEQVQYWTNLTQSGIFLVRYRTKIRDAGMPMPALVSSMPMPSYAKQASQIWRDSPTVTGGRWKWRAWGEIPAGDGWWVWRPAPVKGSS
jgi:hypothetical protein